MKINLKVKTAKSKRGGKTKHSKAKSDNMYSIQFNLFTDSKCMHNNHFSIFAIQLY